MRSFDDLMETPGRSLRVVAGGRGWLIGSVWRRIGPMARGVGLVLAARDGLTPRNHPRRPAIPLPEADMTCHVRGMS